MDERPTRAEVQEALQQQLGGVAAEVEAVKARLRGTGQELQQLRDWQVRLL